MANWFNGRRETEERDRIDALVGLTERIATTVSRRDAFQAVVDVGAQVCEVSNCHILLLDPEIFQMYFYDIQISLSAISILLKVLLIKIVIW